MKHKIWCFFFLFSIAICAQTSKKQWHEGSLTWNDFQDKEMQIYGSVPDYHLEYEIKLTKDKSKRYFRNVSTLYINTDKSTVSSYSKHPQILAYHQVEFDILEFYRRIFQEEIYYCNNNSETNEKLASISQEARNTLNQYRHATLFGAKKDEIEIWSNKTNELLANQNSDFIPEIELSNWGFGIYIGYEHPSFTDSFKSYLNPNGGFSFGVETLFKNSYIFAGLSAIFNEVKQDFYFKKNHESGKKTQFSQFTLSYGYNVFHEKKINLIPFIGLGITSYLEKSDQDNQFWESAFSYNYGLSFDYKLKTIFNLTSDINNKKTNNYLFLRTRLFVNNVKFSEDFKGKSINLGILLGFTSRKGTLKKKS